MTSLEQSGSSSGRVVHRPYRRNPFFTGREESLQRLRTHLVATGPGDSAAAITQAAGISGLGGVGKTQTALEYAYRYADSYRAVLWVQAEDATVLRQSLMGIAGKLGLPEASEADQDRVVVAVMRWLERELGWLLILDNVEDLGLVQQYVPMRHGGHVLLTTRLRALRKVARPLVLGLPFVEEAALLLLRRAGLVAPGVGLTGASEIQREQAFELARELGCLPLALDQAGAYIEEVPSSLAGYLELYRERGG